MEEFLLGALAGGDELDVVHQQYVHGPEAIAKTRHAVETHRGDHFIRKFFRAHVGEPQSWVSQLQFVPDRLHQVRLAQSHSAVKKQRVV